MHRIMLGVDFSPASHRAQHVAVAWARHTGAALRIVHVTPPKQWLVGMWREDLPVISAVHRYATSALQRLAETLDSSGQIEISTGLISGAASVALVRAAQDFDADLLVIGARGEHEAPLRQPVLGGTAAKLLNTSPVPLLLVRTTGADAPVSVLAAVDLSPLSHTVLTWAQASVAGSGRVTVFHAYEAPFAARLAAYGIARESIDLYGDAGKSQRQRDLDYLIAQSTSGADLKPLIRNGDPVESVLRLAQELQSDLIVVGKDAHQRRSRGRGLSGNVSRNIASLAPTNVLIVPPSKRP